MENGVYVCRDCEATKKLPKAPAPIHCPECGKVMHWVTDYRY